MTLNSFEHGMLKSLSGAANCTWPVAWTIAKSTRTAHHQFVWTRPPATRNRTDKALRDRLDRFQGLQTSPKRKGVEASHQAGMVAIGSVVN